MYAWSSNYKWYVSLEKDPKYKNIKWDSNIENK